MAVNAVQVPGNSRALMKKYHPAEFMAAVAEHRVTHVMMVPSPIIALLDAPAM